MRESGNGIGFDTIRGLGTAGLVADGFGDGVVRSEGEMPEPVKGEDDAEGIELPVHPAARAIKMRRTPPRTLEPRGT